MRRDSHTDSRHVPHMLVQPTAPHCFWNRRFGAYASSSRMFSLRRWYATSRCMMSRSTPMRRTALREYRSSSERSRICAISGGDRLDRAHLTCRVRGVETVDCRIDHEIVQRPCIGDQRTHRLVAAFDAQIARVEGCLRRPRRTPASRTRRPNRTRGSRPSAQPHRRRM